MKRAKFVKCLLLLFGLTLQACALNLQNPPVQFSQVHQINDRQARIVAQTITQFVARHNPPASTILLLQPCELTQSDNSLTPILKRQLASVGFGITEQQAEISNTVNTRYVVTGSADGVLITLQVGNLEVTSWLATDDDGLLIADNKFTVREL